MPRPRKALINLTDTLYYHCVSRCVRRAFLCGTDNQTGKSYNHRRQWVEDRLLLLADVFCIDICAYAVMSNHTHVVLRVNKQKADSLSVEEVIGRWHRLYKGMILSRRYVDPTESNTLTDAEVETVKNLAEVYRTRLFDISWFMRLLNEYIARQANKEDECTGHFWEGRFKSQALKDETDIAACMAYVDLNPVRSAIAKTPEKSQFTSIKKRIASMRSCQQPRCLMPFIESKNKNLPDVLPFRFKDYLTLIRQTCLFIQNGKQKNFENRTTSSILDKTGMGIGIWNARVCGIEKKFKTFKAPDKNAVGKNKIHLIN